MKLILASGSPRRKELLQGMGLSFDVLVSDCDESFESGLPASEVAQLLACRKAEAVAALCPGAFVLAADTVVASGGLILNKPACIEEASEMLQELSGKTHLVHTGYCLISPAGSISGFDSTAVTFARLLPSEIEHYTSGGKNLDKAGAYGIQDWIGLIGVERIEGSYFTVMGLPTHKVWQGLKQLGFHLSAVQ